MRLSVSDALVSTAVAAGAATLLWLFAVDIGTISIRANEKPLGTVIFKKMTATRRPSDGLGWERMKNNSPVYDSDTLRTGDLSEAAIFFDDNTSLDLEANSMLKLDFGGPSRNLEFLNGEITVGGSATGSNYVISSKAGTITVGADSSATFSRDEKNNVVGVEVNKGTATLTKTDGSTQTVAENQALEVSTADGTSHFVSRPIVPTRPARNARILDITGAAGATPMAFEWKLDETAGSGRTGSANAKYTLEIAANKDFTDQLSSVQTTGLKTSAPVAPGTWYWRVRDEAGKESPARKFTLASEALPRPAFPDNGASYRYRAVKPDIRFAWTGMEDASSYLFELSDNAQFSATKIRTRVSNTNFSVSDLGEGTWYWRIKPVHGFTEVRGAAADGSVSAEFRTIKIEKSGAMGKIEASTPFAGTFYQIQDVDGKGISFAWIPQTEAVSYELVVSAKSDLSKPALTAKSSLPYVKLAGSAAGSLSKTGTWYWGVVWLDGEGNRSPLNAPRKLIGIDGSVAIRPAFPPDGYRIADSLATNARFAWKTNIAAKTVFVVARDDAFSDVVFQETVTADTILGKSWKAGKYWWKLKALNADNTTFMETTARSFTIQDPLPAPVLAKPASGTALYLRDGTSTLITWNPVAGADYYSIGIYPSGSGDQKPIFERTHIEKPELNYLFGELKSGAYRVKLQAFSLASDMSTRIIGYSGDASVNYRKVTDLEPVSPGSGATIEGLIALRQGVPMEYRNENVPDEQEFILYRGAAGGEIIARSAGKGNAYLQKRLAPGRYAWTVNGKLAGFDISMHDAVPFEVLPVPPLPATTLLEPAANASFGAEWLRTNHALTFRWQPVDGANRYALTVFAKGSPEPIYRSDTITGTECVLQNLALLARGPLVWKIEGRVYGSDGLLEQGGIPAESNFTIDLPAVKRATLKTGDFYGR
jgi:hypothetical protein